MQKFFIQLGIGEKAGSGADFIVKGWQDNKWDRPQLEEKVQPDVVTLTFQLKEVGSDCLSPVCPKLEQVYGESAKMVLYSLCAEDLSISSLMEKTGEKNKNRFRQGVLNPLIDAELIEPTIKDKPTSSKQTYKLTDKAREWMKS